MGWVPKDNNLSDGSHLPRPFLQYDVPASLTKEGSELLRAYYEGLGRFVQMFAETEKSVMETLWAYAGAEREVAKIIFAGTQSDTAANYTKAVARATQASAERLADLENVLNQFGVIRGVRNEILHYGATGIAEGKGLVSNAWKAKAEPTNLPIEAEHLSQMESDLRKIIAHLGYKHTGRPWPKGQMAREILIGVLTRAWLYKRPQAPKSDGSKGKSRRHRKRGRERHRQQQSSDATPQDKGFLK